MLKYGKSEVINLVVGSFVDRCLFGGLHCPAWSFGFPNHGERVAWRLCSGLSPLYPLPLLTFIAMLSLKSVKDHHPMYLPDSRYFPTLLDYIGQQ